MQELITPAQSEIVVAILSLVLAILGGVWAWKRHGVRAAMVFVACGALMFGSWQMHKYLTRFDAQTGYFGLQSVQVLALEAVAFVVIGAVLGVIWSKLKTHQK